jgi:hypothetical protein
MIRDPGELICTISYAEHAELLPLAGHPASPVHKYAPYPFDHLDFSTSYL